MGAYLAGLSRITEPDSFNVDLFLEAIQLESQIDFQQVEVQRSFLLRELLDRLDEEKTLDQRSHP